MLAMSAGESTPGRFNLARLVKEERANKMVVCSQILFSLE